ncbi:TIGR01244 family phosphatase [Mangrovimicrobium sediminis]|uniref:TIGR01244 family phosphatase n=1 Tax=Mangrovimicrobium sediminis TaxID=2562682 RepID=A0A4Z0M4U6_9GAMM|nr:TIGR01244 family sulfur transferase [Haliea sp. SAOS-164]TGD74713.1 TIGR01244 family phosphatase [Haliea sp. SAOS-164]
MQAYRLTDTLAVCGQISTAAVAEIAAAGFKVLVNNRPDGEEMNQPSSAEIQAAAEAAGLEYYHMPVNAMSFPGEQIEEMATLFDDPERPVFAFCRTGTRCTNLWVVSREPQLREEAAAHAHRLGFDLSLAMRML